MQIKTVIDKKVVANIALTIEYDELADLITWLDGAVISHPDSPPDIVRQLRYILDNAKSDMADYL